eukprot:CAMPEP_0194507334 /NCGR_PEP_ID=MMETSP0253-20130528/36721_1 /TAXON_ID=2966 /ORGANISM="Noctiluca scintillans" /LENGTH=90 /DNA_ID=CAMNT_0039350211 /DNA_START=26 /DNA_END=295 /DNA_ORIENTATION=+
MDEVMARHHEDKTLCHWGTRPSRPSLMVTIWVCSERPVVFTKLLATSMALCLHLRAPLSLPSQTNRLPSVSSMNTELDSNILVDNPSRAT